MESYWVLNKKNGDLQTFKENPTPEKAKEILKRVRNNRVTDKEFCTDIESELSEIKNYLEQYEQKETQKKEKNQQGQGNNDEESPAITEENKAQLVENYEGVTPQERQEGVSQIRKVREKMKNIIQKREGEDIEQ